MRINWYNTGVKIHIGIDEDRQIDRDRIGKCI